MSCCPTILRIEAVFIRIRRVDGPISPTCWDSLVWSTVGDVVLWTLGVQSECVQEIRKSSNSSTKDMTLNVSQLQETKNDRNNFYRVVTALQRHQLKAIVSSLLQLFILFAAILIYHRLSLQVPKLVCFECIMIYLDFWKILNLDLNGLILQR